ncbi:MAG TPA: NUDIX hydrolase [Gammaproteobacteria bacterium]|nr:NUDIX hydrolase [Gammaproteobacteria bacterium]
MSRPPEDAEILSVVDASDAVIGEQRRDEIHLKGLRHRAVHVLVFNPRGQLFLQQRGLPKKEHPGMWDSSVAGHVDAGESYDDCCVREVEEEVGLSLDRVPQRLFKLEASNVTGMEFAWVYRVDTAKTLRPNLEEMSGGDWFDPADIDQWIDTGAKALSAVFRLIWQTYRGLTE